MKADNINFRGFITAGDRTFTIPVYQRNYEWKEPECSKLFVDIENIAGGSRSHFVGTIVYVTSDINPTWSEFTVIDGQQRITTIMLLLKAIHDISDDDRVKRQIWNTYLTNEYASEEKYRLKLKPIESDYDTWNDVIDGQVPDNTSSNLWKNYELFKAKIQDSNYSPLELFEAVGKLEIVYIQLETGKENPQIIFESINSTGLSLTQGDLIRNFLLMNCESQEKQSRLYKDYWVKIERFLTTPVIPDFVRDYLSMKMGNLINKNDVYEKFKLYFAKSYEGTEEDCLKELCRYAEYYNWFRVCKSEDNELNLLLKQFHEIKSTIAFSIMLWFFDKCYNERKLTITELRKTLQILLCYQFRRSVCKYTSNSLGKTYMVLPRELGNAEDVPKKLLEILVKKTKTQTFPKNEEFRSSFISFDLYSSKLAKYALTMIENKTNPKEKVSLTEQITIEHIMPQTLSTTWKAEIGKNFEETHSIWLHTIGNLTFTGYNSELGNMPFGEKKAKYNESNFSLTRKIAKSSTWKEDDIKNRANELADTALEIWGLPDEFNIKPSDKTETNYEKIYNLMDNVTITNESPRSYFFMDEEKTVYTWKALFLSVLKELYDFDNLEFEKILRHETFIGRHLAEPSNSDYKYRSKSPNEICPGYYAETGHSAQDLMFFTQIAVEIYGFQDEIYFTLKRKGKHKIINGISASIENEQDFKDWFVESGRSSNTAQQYITILKETLNYTFNLQGIVKTNILDYDNFEEFEKAYRKIQELHNYVDLNRESHNRYSAALNAYADYLKLQSDNSY